MKKTADVIVVGLGAHGSAALYQLAKRGIKVIGIDRFSPPHSHGSSHGESRIIRLACGEGVEYTAFAEDSLAIWFELEDELKLRNQLYLNTGGLMIGVKDGKNYFHGRKNFVDTTIEAAKKYTIPHRLLSADDIRKEFPLFKVTDDEYGYYEQDAGILFPEACIEANLLIAERYGAGLRRDVAVHNIRQDGNTVTVSTSDGVISAKNCIVAAGAFVNHFLPERYRKLFKITRQILYWFTPASRYEKFHVGNFPVYIWEREGIYGFPDIGSSAVKVAFGAHGRETDPAKVDRLVADEEFRTMEETLGRAITSLPGLRLKSATCLYTNTPDDDFVIDRHPEMPNVLVVSACSGHGFKHSAAVGELATKIATNEKHCHDISPFSFDRFKNVL